MNDMLFRTLLKRYEANIEDALYKIQSLSENNIIIPEHVDITGEADKLLQIMAEAEDKVAVMRKYYVQNKADKQVIWQCIRVIPDKLHVLKKNIKKKCLYVQNIKNKGIPTFIIYFSGHFSGHFILKGHYIMSKAVVPSRARKAVNV